jgi:neopullulanase
MQGGEDPDNRRNFPGGFHDAVDANERAFSSAGRAPQEQDTFAWASALFGFRKQHPVLQNGEQQNIFVDDTAFAFVRAGDVRKGCSESRQSEKIERFLIVVNNADHPRQLSINTEETAAQGCVHFEPALTVSNSVAEATMEGTTLHILVNSHGFRMYRLR